MQLLGEGAAAAHGAHVGGHHHDVVESLAELLGIIIHENGVTQQIVHRDVEEALNLVGVQVHGQHPVGAGGGDHVGHQLGGDGVAALGLAVLPGVAEIGNHGGDTAGAGPLAGVDHHQQLHQPVVDGLAGGVDEEHVAAADALIQGYGGLAVGEGLHLCLAQLDADNLADLLCQRGVGVAAENLDVLAVRNHSYTRFLSVVGLDWFCIQRGGRRNQKNRPHPAGKDSAAKRRIKPGRTRRQKWSKRHKYSDSYVIRPPP